MILDWTQDDIAKWHDAKEDKEARLEEMLENRKVLDKIPVNDNDEELFETLANILKPILYENQIINN
jgi:hypothetical protein